MMARLSCTNAMTSASELAVHKVHYSKANAKMTCISGNDNNDKVESSTLFFFKHISPGSLVYCRIGLGLGGLLSSGGQYPRSEPIVYYNPYSFRPLKWT